MAGSPRRAQCSSNFVPNYKHHPARTKFASIHVPKPKIRKSVPTLRPKGKGNAPIRSMLWKKEEFRSTARQVLLRSYICSVWSGTSTRPPREWYHEPLAQIVASELKIQSSRRW